MILEALAISTIAETVCRSRLFRPIQKWHLFKCSYCFAHYVAFAFALCNFTTIYNLIVNTFCLVTLSIPGMLLIEYLLEKLEQE